jgi:hypothetical protein
MTDPAGGNPLPPTSTEIASLVKRIETLEAKPDASAADVAALKAALKKLTDAAAAKPERKRDQWGWPIE